MLEALTSDIQAAAAVTDGPKRRLESVKAAATSTDPRKKEAFQGAVKMLKRLGVEIDAIAASGDASSLASKMKELKWAPVQQTQLKLYLNIIGCTA